MKKRFLAIITCILLLFSIISIGISGASAVSAKHSWDVGNYNDYGGGDYGGGWDSYDYDYDYDNDYNYSYDYDDDAGVTVHSNSSSSEFTIFTLLRMLMSVVVPFAVIVILLLVLRKKGNTTAKTRPATFVPAIPGDHTTAIVAAIRKIDPNFSSDTFITWSKDVFITLQQAWTARDWSTIRPLEKEELFEQHKRQLDEYIRNKKINIIERINVGQTHLHKYERDAQYEYLTVYMATRMVDYIIDENTRQVLKGDPNKDCYMNYLLTFMRKTGVKSREGTDRSVSKSCPNCGAPLSITSSGKCDYCGSIITTGDFDWVLAKMDAVKPNTVIDNRGVIINDGSENNS